MNILRAFAVWIALCCPVFAQQAKVVSSCGGVTPAYDVNGSQPLTVTLDGKLCTNSTPVSTAATALNHSKSAALESSRVASVVAANLYSYSCTAITGTITAGSSYSVAYNANAAPSAGALTASLVLDVCTISASSGCSLGHLPNGVNYGAGIVILLTSAATPFTYTTGTNTGFLSADYK